MPYAESHHKRRVAISTIFQQGKTQVPAEVRISLNVKMGEKIIWIIEDGKWVVEKA